MKTAIRILFHFGQFVLRRATAITLLVFLTAACGALAQATVDFDQVDANHDGRIRERFNRLDQDHKGYLDRNDWKRR